MSAHVAGRDVELSGATDERTTTNTFIESVGAISGVRLVHSSLTALPRSVPFSLSAKPEGDSTVLSGNIPSEALRGKLVGALSANGRKVIDHLTYRGAVPSSMGSASGEFGAAAEAAIAALAQLGDGYVAIQGNQITIGGYLRRAEDGKAIEKDLRASLPASFKVSSLDLKQPAVQAGSPPPASSPEPERSSPSSSSPLSTVAPYPFTLEMGKGTVHLSGDAPDEDSRRAIGLAAASQFFDAKVKNDLTIAAGAPTGFSSAVINAIPALARLGRGSLTLSGNSASVEGDALYPNATKEIGSALEAAFGKGFTLKSEIGVASSPPLDPAVCQPSFDRLLDVGHINYATDSAVIPAEAAPGDGEQVAKGPAALVLRRGGRPSATCRDRTRSR